MSFIHVPLCYRGTWLCYASVHLSVCLSQTAIYETAERIQLVCGIETSLDLFFLQ